MQALLPLEGCVSAEPAQPPEALGGSLMSLLCRSSVGCQRGIEWCSRFETTGCHGADTLTGQAAVVPGRLLLAEAWVTWQVVQTLAWSCGTSR